MKRPRHRAPRERGFALVETLVATAVVAAMTAVFYETVIADADIAAAVRERRAAALVAQSVLAEAAGPATATAPDTAGNAGELTWTITRAFYGDDLRGSGPPLERLTVRIVSRRTGRPVFVLQTLRLAR